MSGNDWKTKFMEGLLEERQVYLGGEIDEGVANHIEKAVLWLNSRDRTEIKLIINSGGGSVNAGLAIYDTIRCSKSPVTGLVLRQANSMALVILQACQKRIARPSSIFCFHNIKLSLCVEWEEFEEMGKKKIEDIKKYQEIIDKVLAVRSGRDIEKIKEINKNKMILSAGQMKNLGFIDEIV